MAVGVLNPAKALHPDSWNAFDSLGEAYAANGDKAPAIAAYRQSLVLKPQERQRRGAAEGAGRGA